MNVTVPHRQKGSALSSLRFAQGQALSEAKDLSAERDRPFASLRVTRWDGCNGEGLFFTTEPCLSDLKTLLIQKRFVSWRASCKTSRPPCVLWVSASSLSFCSFRQSLRLLSASFPFSAV